MRTKNILFFMCFAVFYFSLVWALPKWASIGHHCQSGTDCPLDYCCAIGFVRYSVPQCQPMGQIGDWCRTNNEPQNRTLAYPNGESHEFSQIYIQFCRCSAGLVCERAKCTAVSNINFESTFFDDYF